MNKKILIVEDDLILAEDLKRILMNFGYEVPAIEASGKGAINAVGLNHFDLILMDILLEGEMDGIEAVQQIHSEYNIPVVYLTGNNSIDILERAKISEPYSFLIKPFDHRELYAHIEIAINKHQVELRLAYLNSILGAIKRINQLIVREKKYSPLLNGVCNLLLDTGCFETAWIATKEKQNTYNLAAYSGNNSEFEALKKIINSTNRPDCLIKASMQSNTLLKFENDPSCKGCPVSEFHKNKNILAARMYYDNKIYGILNVSIASKFNDFKEEKELIKEVADDISFALQRLELEKERKKLEEQLYTAAITDELTGLYNRRGFFTLGEQQYKLAVRTRGKLSLLYLDLDNLKIINDRYGHKVGDTALMDTAKILKKTFRKSDIIGRIGGDEFAVLLIDHQGGDFEAIVTQNIDKRLAMYNQRGHRKYHLSLSMGMAYFDPEKPCSIGTLLTKADAAMYEAKYYRQMRLTDKPSLTFPKQKVFKRRIHKRFDINNYRLTIPGIDTCEIKNISLGGMCLKSPKKLPIKKAYSLKIHPAIYGSKILKGEVIWSSSNDQDKSEKGLPTQYEIGLKFVTLNNLQENALNRFILKLSS